MNGLPGRPAALVCERDEQRLALIRRVVGQCGGDAVCLQSTDTDVVCDQCAKANSAALIINLDGGFREDSLLQIFERLSQRNTKPVCYTRSFRFWPVGRRCKLLLAGATWILDSRSAVFEENLYRALSPILCSHAEQRDEYDRQRELASQLGMVGQSRSLLSVVAWLDKVSVLSDIPVLIHGETGTGKELVAQSLHSLDPKRSAGPLVALNCSSVSPALAESELFGHMRGAFTGSEASRDGAFRSASGGVLFLDEIGELPLEMQAKLLRVLQERRVRAVGGDSEVDVDVRVIAATHRDLNEMMMQGGFRADLFHRLCVLHVKLPPLRERRDDIGPLVEHFIGKYASLNSHRRLTIGSDYLEALTKLELPGNIRQLENIIRWTLVNKEEDGPLGLSDLSPDVWSELADRDAVRRENPVHTVATSEKDLSSQLREVMECHDWSLAEALKFCESIMLESALEHTNGNQSRAAQLMGITPRSVHNKIRKHGLRN